MSGIRTLEENIARLEAATERARQATREANSATKEARTILKELQTEIVKFDTDLKKVIESVIASEVKTGLEWYAKIIQEKTQEARDAVFRSFDSIKNLMLTGHEDGSGEHLIRPWLRAEIAEGVKQYMKRVGL